MKVDQQLKLNEDEVTWLAEFDSACAKSTSPTEIATHLAQLGIDDPEAPLEFPRWMDPANPVFNKRIHEVLVKHNFLLRVRKVLLADLKTDCPHIEVGWDATTHVCHLYGKLVLKSWNQSVLDNFLKVKPTESWCPSTTT